MRSEQEIRTELNKLRENLKSVKSGKLNSMIKSNYIEAYLHTIATLEWVLHDDKVNF